MPTYTAMTVRRAVLQGFKPSRSFGYVVLISPPIITQQTGEDVEGVGWVQFNHPRQHVQNFHGWYKRKASASATADRMNRA